MPFKPEYVLMLEQTPHFGAIGICLSENGTVLNVKRVDDGNGSFYQVAGIPRPPVEDLDYSSLNLIRADPDMQLWLHGQWRNLADVVDQLYSRRIDVLETPEEDAKLYRSALKLAAQENLDLPTSLVSHASEESLSLDVLVESGGAVAPKPGFQYRNRVWYRIAAGPAIVAPFVLVAMATKDYAIGAVLAAIASAGVILTEINIRAEGKQLEQFKKQYSAKMVEAENKRKQLKQLEEQRLSNRMEAINKIMRIYTEQTERMREYDAVRESLLHAGIAKGIFPQEYGLRQ